MVKKEQSKRQKSIKSKLLAAVCMLLVSCIMMVSSTYAWFTLSTAPEVTGITTSVGANGNLEMALQPLDGNSTEQTITSGTGDSMYGGKAVNAANLTWGNLVNLKTGYGLENVMLYPAKLNTQAGTDGYELALKTSPLATPEYGADGRVVKLEENTLTGVYDGSTGFNNTNTTVGDDVETLYGVRAVGTSSGMSDRKLAYRAALSSASTAASLAKSTASTSLNKNGAALADLAIKHATFTSTESVPTEVYSVAELRALETIINELLGYDTVDGTTTVHTTGALEYIEDALIQYALASALATKASDENYATYVTAFNGSNGTGGATLSTLTSIMSTNEVVNAGVTEHIDELTTAISNVQAAKTIIVGLLYDEGGALVAENTTFEWKDFNEALYKLADPDNMQVNGIAVKDLKGNWLHQTGEELPDGYYVSKGENSETAGYVYDDEGKIVSNMSRLVDAVLNDGLNLIIASGAGVYADIADFCGDYSASVTLSKISYGGMTVKNLDATMSTKTSVDTIYLTLANNGVGTYSDGVGTTASSNITDFYGYIIDLAFRTNVAGSNLQLQADAVDRIYTDGTNTDTMGHGASMTFKPTDATVFSNNQVKALMKSIRIVFFDTDTRGIIGYARLDEGSAQNTADGITMKLVMTDDEGTPTGNSTIMALEQSAIHELSIMVYLDGESVTNKDVANAASSMVGSMNLQFSSSATLVPMEYSDLKSGDGGSQLTATPTNVTDKLAANSPASVAYHYNGKLGVVISNVDGDSGKTVTINGTAATYGTVGTYSAWVIDMTDAPTTEITVVVADAPASGGETQQDGGTTTE